MKQKQSRFIFTSLLGLAGATCLTSAALASGFGLREGSADWLGNAFSGETANAYDAGTAASNPAGMVRLDQDEIDGAISYIGPSATFTGSNSNPYGAGTVSGVTGGNVVAPAASGATFGVFRLAPDLWAGFAVTAPYGERTSYPKDFVGRYQSLVSAITDINLGLSLAYKVNDHLSIAAGPNFDYFAARLTQALDVPTLSAATGQDPISALKGNDLGIGYNLGALYQFDDATRIGIDYRSRIQHNLTGNETVTVPGSYPAPYPALLEANNGIAKTSITLPDSLSVGLYHQLTPRWAVMGSVQWTDWSLFNNLNVTTANGTPLLSIAEKWRNTWYAGMGANYQATDKLLLQTGFAYDQSPVDNANRTTRVPDADHYILSVGAKYQLLQNVNMQLAYAHIFTPGGTINNSAAAPGGLAAGIISGSYDASDNSVTAGVAVKF
jgi:long-chain fatty acid transport protein